MNETPTWAGPFHRREIPRGVYGELSKLEEERVEALDAIEQGQRLMFLVELADILGALNGVTEHRLGVSVDELWQADPRTPVPVTNMTLYDFAAKRSLEEIRERIKLLDVEGVGFGEQALEIISTLLSLSIPHGLDFDDLNHFARLRSQVARYALANAGQ